MVLSLFVIASRHTCFVAGSSELEGSVSRIEIINVL